MDLKWKTMSYLQTPTASVIHEFKNKLYHWDCNIRLLLWKNDYNPKDYRKPYLDDPIYIKMIMSRKHYMTSLYD